MKKFLVSMAVAALALPVLAQSSAPMRVAVIDVNKVLRDSAAGKVASAKMKSLSDEKTAKAQKMNDEIAALDNEINNKEISLSEEKLERWQQDAKAAPLDPYDTLSTREREVLQLAAEGLTSA